MAVIGEVGIAVVPDATNFWRKFEAATTGGADVAGAKAGEQFAQAFRATAEATLKDLPDAKVGLDPDAEGFREKVRLLTADLPDAKVGLDTKDAEHKVSLLRDSILVLGTAGVVAGAGAVAAFAGVASGAALVALGISSINAEIKAGTPIGKEYGVQVGALKTSFDGLRTSIVTAVAPTTFGIMHDLITFISTNTPAINQLAVATATVVRTLVSGLLGGFHNFQPVLLNVLQTAGLLAQKFADWASGPGGAKFADQLLTAFHQLMPLVSNLATTLGKIFQASLPLGGGIIGALSDFLGLLNHVPIPVLTGILAVLAAARVVNAGAAVAGFFASSVKLIAAARGEATGVVALKTAEADGVIAQNARIIASNAEARASFAGGVPVGAVPPVGGAPPAGPVGPVVSTGSKVALADLAGRLAEVAAAGFVADQALKNINEHNHVSEPSGLDRFKSAWHDIQGVFSESATHAAQAQKEIQNSYNSLVPPDTSIPIRIDVSKVAPALQGVANKVNAMNYIRSNTTIDANVKPISSKLDDTNIHLDQLAARHPTPILDANNAAAKAKTAAATAAANAYGKLHPNPTLNADNKPALGATQIAKNAADAFDRLHPNPTLNADPKPALAGVNTAQAAIDNLHGTTVAIGVVLNQAQAANVRAEIAAIHLATGGIIRGPGTGTSDTAGLYALSTGEAVIPAVAVQHHRHLIEALIAEGRGTGVTPVGQVQADDIMNGIASRFTDVTPRGSDGAAVFTARSGNDTDRVVGAVSALLPPLRELYGMDERIGQRAGQLVNGVGRATLARQRTYPLGTGR